MYSSTRYSVIQYALHVLMGRGRLHPPTPDYEAPAKAKSDVRLDYQGPSDGKSSTELFRVGGLQSGPVSMDTSALSCAMIADL
eukprot:SAG31_NODE_2011_length_6669_cov_2.063927_8_plen_83_part_00